MKAATSPRRNRGLRKLEFKVDDLAGVDALLREAGPIMSEGNPVAAHGHYDAKGRPRRVHATYANGVRVTLVMRVDGIYSLSQAIKLVSRPKAAKA